LSSHILSEVDRVCSRIGLIRSGRLVAVQTLHELRAATPRRLTVVFSQPVDAAVPAAPGWVLPASPGWIVVTREPQRWVIDVRGPIGAFIAALSGLPVADIHLAPFAIEDALLRFFAETPAKPAADSSS
jgi:ABC-2 type transport system ATP-binding protein